jgi:hypothetical protein
MNKKQPTKLQKYALHHGVAQQRKLQGCMPQQVKVE